MRQRRFARQAGARWRRAAASLSLALASTILSACAGTFRLPAEGFYPEFRGDFGPGPAERDEGGVLAFYVYPSAVSDARCRLTPDGGIARCRFRYTYGGDWFPMEGRFERRGDGSWRYLSNSARRL